MQCISECKEKLKYASQLPSGIEEEEIDGENRLILGGISDKQGWQRIMDDIIYVNIANFPENGKRNVLVEVQDSSRKTVVSKEISVVFERKRSEIKLQGICDGQRDAQMLFKQGIRLCGTLKIVMNGCAQTVDFLRIDVEPVLSKKEKIYIASAYLKRHQLTLVPIKSGFFVYGVAGVSQYNEILSHIKYSYNGILTAEIIRTIKVSICRLKVMF